ncbi:protein snakeskin [Anastrepha obliqua]|uniref:protein snakeskin n=1 Tax=Anastrepha ludens TaxID=28586 RepID=UPI0023AEEF7F|nr:protein snakeskin [Anastrepha ludens]XP_054730084.1 protein snakeskin [Anastrepha obliqua]
MEFNNRLLLKIIELGISIACIVLWQTSTAISSQPLIVCGTLGGFTIICGILLIGHILNSIVEKRLNALISIIGCILFVISGALIIDEWHDRSDFLFKDSKRNALATGSLMIINGAVFLLDTLSICRT